MFPMHFPHAFPPCMSLIHVSCPPCILACPSGDETDKRARATPRVTAKLTGLEPGGGGVVVDGEVDVKPWGRLVTRPTETLKQRVLQAWDAVSLQFFRNLVRAYRF